MSRVNFRNSCGYDDSTLNIVIGINNIITVLITASAKEDM